MADSPQIQLIYASTATFGDGNIETPSTQREVFQIVRKSRANNADWGVVGALSFGDGCFLQVLEGEQGAIDRLFEVIENDPRHRDIRVLRRDAVDAPGFAKWSMKFPTMDEGLRASLGLQREDRFEPYKLTTPRIDALLKALQAAQDQG